MTTHTVQPGENTWAKVLVAIERPSGAFAKANPKIDMTAAPKAGTVAQVPDQKIPGLKRSW